MLLRFVEIHVPTMAVGTVSGQMHTQLHKRNLYVVATHAHCHKSLAPESSLV